MSANHLMDKTEKAIGNAFEITNEEKAPSNSVMMMDSTFIYFHDTECALRFFDTTLKNMIFIYTFLRRAL